MVTNQEFQENGIVGIDSNGMLLFDFDNALKMVERYEAEGALILGIEGFYLLGDAIIPEMDAIADYSELCFENDREKFVVFAKKASISFLNANQGRGLWFEFVTDKDEE